MQDYWRFTPRGLRTLLERAGLEVEEVGSWGNRDCVVGNFDSWSAFRRWHSLRNEPDLPVQVWAFARRPVAAGLELLGDPRRLAVEVPGAEGADRDEQRRSARADGPSRRRR